jgi:hypothetical protein
MKKNLFIFLLFLLTSPVYLCALTPKETSIKNMTAQEALVPTMLTPKVVPAKEKDWTFLVYVAADNDLAYFAGRNIEEMKKIGSTKHINVLVQLDGQGAHEKTKRLYIEKNKTVQVNYNHPSSQQKLDFGSALTLIDACQWAIEDYPAKHYALILWNHGIGILDNIGGRTSAASELFSFNTETNMLELNRDVGYFDHIKQKQPRGVCFGDTYGTYLTNQKLEYALKEVTAKLPQGKKFDIVGFDACLMSMIEQGNLIRPYTHFMVASQEIELGTGWPYHKILAPFTEKTLSPEELSKHIVNVYHHNYKAITYDYTLSAVDLTNFEALEKGVSEVANLLLQALTHQRNNTVTRLIRASKSKRLCTYFSEPSYLDLHHLLCNLSETLDFMALEPGHLHIKKELKEKLVSTRQALEKTVVANCCGRNLTQARGLSIYFPTRLIESSYVITPFAEVYSWLSLLRAMT